MKSQGSKFCLLQTERCSGTGICTSLQAEGYTKSRTKPKDDRGLLMSVLSDFFPTSGTFTRVQLVLAGELEIPTVQV